MKKRKAMLLLALTAAVSLMLSACGGGAEAPAAKESSGESETSADEERPYYVHDSAEITGKLNIYTTMEETQQEVLQELWNKYYPDCELEIQADSIGTLADDAFLHHLEDQRRGCKVCLFVLLFHITVITTFCYAQS